VTAQPGDSVASLAARMNVGEYQEDRFRVLNGLGPRATVQPGQRFKIVR
jgi:predicted Zn-dependent protease